MSAQVIDFRTRRARPAPAPDAPAKPKLSILDDMSEMERRGYLDALSLRLTRRQRAELEHRPNDPNGDDAA